MTHFNMSLYKRITLKNLSSKIHVIFVSFNIDN